MGLQAILPALAYGSVTSYLEKDQGPACFELSLLSYRWIHAVPVFLFVFSTFNYHEKQFECDGKLKHVSNMSNLF